MRRASSYVILPTTELVVHSNNCLVLHQKYVLLQTSVYDIIMG